MSYSTVYNPGDHPVVVDELGRTIGGGEWGTVRTTDSVTSELISSGVLFQQNAPTSDDVNPVAAVAFERTASINDRATSLDAASRAQLVAFVQQTEVQYPGGEENPTKAELVAFLSTSDSIDLKGLTAQNEITSRAAKSSSAAEKKVEA